VLASVYAAAPVKVAAALPAAVTEVKPAQAPSAKAVAVIGVFVVFVVIFHYQTFNWLLLPEVTLI